MQQSEVMSTRAQRSLLHEPLRACLRGSNVTYAPWHQHVEGPTLPPLVVTPEVPPPTRAAATPQPQVFQLYPANITAVSTATELMHAVTGGALDIEIRAHLDLGPLLRDIRAAFYDRNVWAPREQRRRRMQADALAMFQVASTTRSIRVSPLHAYCD